MLCNPPYVPDGTPVPPEVASFDPPGAVFGGPDGLEIIRAVVTAAAALLRHGGRLGIEHDDTHADAVPELLRRRRVLTDVEEHATWRAGPASPPPGRATPRPASGSGRSTATRSSSRTGCVDSCGPSPGAIGRA